MALTTSGAKQVVVERFYEGLLMPSEAWRPTVDFRTDNVPSLRLANISGIGEVPTWDGASDLTTTTYDSESQVTLTGTDYGVQVRIGKRDAEDIPELVGNAARKLGVAVASTYGARCATLYTNAFSDTVAIDSVALCSASHTTASAATRSNASTSALDRTAFMAAITAFRNWDSYQDLPYDLVSGGFYLVVPPALEETAAEVIGSQYSSSELQTNVAGSYNTSLIVWPQLSSAVDWFLVSKVETPLTFWQKAAPMPNVVVDQDNQAIKINVDFSVAVDAGPDCTGIYGANV